MSESPRNCLDQRQYLDDELTDAESFTALYTRAVKTIRTVLCMSQAHKEGWLSVWQALCALYRNDVLLSRCSERLYERDSDTPLDIDDARSGGLREGVCMNFCVLLFLLCVHAFLYFACFTWGGFQCVHEFCVMLV